VGEIQPRAVSPQLARSVFSVPDLWPTANPRGMEHHAATAASVDSSRAAFALPARFSIRPRGPALTTILVRPVSYSMAAYAARAPRVIRRRALLAQSSIRLLGLALAVGHVRSGIRSTAISVVHHQGRVFRHRALLGKS